MDVLPKFLELSVEKKFPGNRIDKGIQSLDYLGENAGQKCDCAAGNTWNYVCGSHSEAFDAGKKMLGQSVHIEDVI